MKSNLFTTKLYDVIIPQNSNQTAVSLQGDTDVPADRSLTVLLS
jgi:hypothetical protein